MSPSTHVKLTAIQKINLRLRGHAFVGYRTKPGWRGALPFYAFRCHVHGIVEDYPHGYKQLLACPFCKKTRTHPPIIPQDENRLPEIVS